MFVSAALLWTGWAEIGQRQGARTGRWHSHTATALSAQRPPPVQHACPSAAPGQLPVHNSLSPPPVRLWQEHTCKGPWVDGPALFPSVASIHQPKAEGCLQTGSSILRVDGPAVISLETTIHCSDYPNPTRDYEGPRFPSYGNSSAVLKHLLFSHSVHC